MQNTQTIDNSCFAELLMTQFVAKSVPASSKLDANLELIKGKAALLSLTIFDHLKKDAKISPCHTFSSLFSEKTYGAGFTKGLSILWAYLIAFEEEGVDGKSVTLTEFAQKVRVYCNEIFKSVKAGGVKLPEVRKQAEQFDNYGGYYDRTYLSLTALQELAPKGFLQCPLVVDPYSGHLIAKVDADLSQKLLDAYRDEITPHLTETGKGELKLPFNLGLVTVAYKEELAKLSPEKIDELLSMTVNLSFKETYVVPVRGDNRYALIAGVIMDSPEIIDIRLKLGLNELYSEGRPLRYTFGAVHHSHLKLEEAELLEKMNNNEALKPWMEFVSTIKA